MFKGMAEVNVEESARRGRKWRSIVVVGRNRYSRGFSAILVSWA